MLSDRQKTIIKQNVENLLRDNPEALEYMDEDLAEMRGAMVTLRNLTGGSLYALGIVEFIDYIEEEVKVYR